MKINLIHPLTLSQEKSNIINTVNIIKTPNNNYSSKNIKVLLYNKKKHKKKLKINLIDKADIFSLDEEYVSKLKYYSPDLNRKGFKKETLYNINTSNDLPIIFKKYQIIDNKNFEENRKKLMSKINVKKQIFEKNIYDEMEHTRYVGRLENMYKENTLETKRHELELKIKKIKSLMELLSKELSDTLSQIENSKIDLDIFQNYKNIANWEKRQRKLLFKESNSNLNIFNLMTNRRESIKSKISINTKYSVNNESNSFEKDIKNKKGKEFEKKIYKEIFKNRRKSILEEKKLSIKERLTMLNNKKSNILVKLESCERDLKDFKERHNLIKNELLIHYHKLLLEGKDTRKDGLSWIIKSIWNLKSNVIMSFIPKFLDMNSISFLFLYSDKLAEIENFQKKIENISNEIKKKEKKSKKLAHLCKMILKDTHKDKYLKHINEYSVKKHKSKKKVEDNKNEEIDDVNDIKDNNNNNNSIDLKKSNKKLKSVNVFHDDIMKNKLKEIHISPHRENTVKEKKLKRLFSQPDILTINNIHISENFFEKNKTSSNLNFEETFKTSLYKTNSLKKSISKNNSDLDSSDFSINSNKKKKNLKNILLNPKYAEKFSLHLSPQKKIKVKDYENFQNFKIEDSIDKELLNLFKEHKEMIKKLKVMKSEADKLVRKELDRVGKCFYLEDYEGKYNTNIKTVIGALIGEDNIRGELLRQEKEQKDYFKTIKSIRNFNGLFYKKYL